MNEAPQVSQQEWRWVWAFALVIMLITTLPYLVGYSAQGDDWRFTGFLVGVEDGNSYIAKMLSGSEGAWLFRTPYTAALQRGVVAFFPYILLGKLTAPPAQHEQLVAIFHLFRVGGGILAVMATYEFLSLFLQRVWPRRFALALATLGGGLGWALVLARQGTWLGSLPLDLYSPETFGFLSLFTLPHLALGRAFLLWGLVRYLRPGNTQTGIFDVEGLRAGLLWLALGFMQPLTVVVAWYVAGVHLLGLGALVWLRKQAQDLWWMYLRRLVWAGLVSLPIVAYTAFAFQRDPFLQAWTAQNRIFSPHPLHYLAAYGLLLLFAILGARNLLKTRPVQGLLPVAWCLSLPVLAYAPIALQRRLPEGIWVALSVLAFAALDRPPPLQIWLRGAAYTLLPLAFPSTIMLLLGAYLAAARPAEPAFRLAAEAQAFEFLAEVMEPGEVVLSAYETGNALPAFAPARVVIGHGPESAGLEELRPEVRGFYQQETVDAMRVGMLQEWRVRYVFWGPNERSLGDWQPGQAGFLRLIYQDKGYEIYELQAFARTNSNKAAELNGSWVDLQPPGRGRFFVFERLPGEF